jgi:peptidoglycan-N-acetylglucosamine deacetylase
MVTEVTTYGKMQMKTFALPILCAGLLLAQRQVSRADHDCPANALGVSRIAQIDTAGGPWFGEPNGDANFLAQGEVVLTFDDGPSPRYTRTILEALAAQCTKATFFLVGEMAAESPDLVRETVSQGHTVGTHTWSHPNLAHLSDEKAKAQIETAFAAAEKAVRDHVAPFFRYPYLSSSRANVAYLESRNIAQFAIDIDSLDWRDRNPETVIKRVMHGLERRGKGIILFHDIHNSTAKALPAILSLLKTKGFRVVHLQPKSAFVAVAGYERPPTEIKSAPHSHRWVTHTVVAHRVPQQ